MPTVGEVGIDIRGNASQFRSSLKSAEGAVRSFSSIGQNLVQGFGMALGNLSFASATQGVKNLIGAMVGGNAQFEKFNLQFEVLLKSSEAAKKRMAELAVFAKETPFELPDVVNASRLLEVMGGELLSTGESLRLIGDAASGAGRGFEEVAMWAGRYYAGLKAGKSDGEALLRLREMALISGDASMKLADLAENGGKASDMWAVFTGELGRFSGMMEKQSKTFDGIMSNMRDSIGAILRDIGRPFFEKAKEGLIAVYEYVTGTEGQALIGRLKVAAQELGRLSVEGGVDFFRKVAEGVVRFIEFVASEAGQRTIATIVKITGAIIALSVTSRAVMTLQVAFVTLTGAVKGALGFMVAFDALNKRSAAGWAVQAGGANTLTASLVRVRGAAVAAAAGFTALIGIAGTAAAVLAIPVGIASAQTKHAEAEAKFAEARAGMMKSKLLESFERRFHQDVQKGDAAVEKTFRSMEKRFGSNNEIFQRYKTLLGGWLAQKGKAINAAGVVSKTQNEKLVKDQEDQMRKLMEGLTANVGKGGGGGAKKKGKSEAEREEEARLERVAGMFQDIRLKLATLKAATLDQRLEAERLHGAYGELTRSEWASLKPLLAEEDARNRAKDALESQAAALKALNEQIAAQSYEDFISGQREIAVALRQVANFQQAARDRVREYIVELERQVAIGEKATELERARYEMANGSLKAATFAERLRIAIMLVGIETRRKQEEAEAKAEELRKNREDRYLGYLKDLALRLQVAGATSEELRMKFKLLAEGLSAAQASDVIEKTRAVEKLEEFRSMIEGMSGRLSEFLADTFTNLFNGRVKSFFSDVVGGFRAMLAEMANEYLKSYLKKVFMNLLLKVLGAGGGGGSDLMSGGEGGLEQLAHGGTAKRNVPYIVGERGVELFVPNQTGSVVPNDVLGRMGGSPINVTINVSTPDVEGFKRSQSQIIANAVSAAMAAARRNRG
jgi:hypothetical protein